jgi:hypothetical protein
VGTVGAINVGVGGGDTVAAIPFGLGTADSPFRASSCRPWLASTPPSVAAPIAPYNDLKRKAFVLAR